MPFPDFSELTFGYAFLREFEKQYTRNGSFPAAPDFITQAAEATLGYDVSSAGRCHASFFSVQAKLCRAVMASPGICQFS